MGGELTAQSLNFVAWGAGAATVFLSTVSGHAVGLLSDLYVYDSVNETWTNLSSAFAGIVPTARCFFGFSAVGNELFVHGGWNGGL